MEVKLKPCPFCGADNKPMGAIMRTANRGEWKHWYNGCVLSGFVIKADKIEAWNRRASKGGSIVKALRCCAELNCRECPLEKLREEATHEMD